MRRTARFSIAIVAASAGVLAVVFAGTKLDWLERPSVAVGPASPREPAAEADVDARQAPIAECEPVLQSLRRQAEGFRQCSQASDCMEVRSPYVDFIAMNRSHRVEFEALVERLPMHCRSKKIIESLAVRAPHGTTFGCELQLCTYRRITSAERHESLLEDLGRSIDESVAEDSPAADR